MGGASTWSSFQGMRESMMGRPAEPVRQEVAGPGV
jgi:hypothetical protein